MKNKLLIICGPTASNKSALAVECAKLMKSEIISADSMDIYRGLDIGTAKPSINELNAVKHHLINVVNPNETFTVSQYKEIAEPIVKDLLSNDKIPVVCGGTGFYINSLLFDFSYGNGEKNDELREKYKRLAKENGNEYVYNILKEIDPKSAEKLHFNDLKRVIRAIEICSKGVKKSDIIDDKTPKYNYDAYAIDYDREYLYERINKRVDLMIKNGLIEEVKSLFDNGITLDNQCMQGIGYKEIVEYLNGNITLEDAVELIKLNTRHYAKRQITYFKKLEGLIWLKPDKTEVLAQRIVEKL